MDHKRIRRLVNKICAAAYGKKLPIEVVEYDDRSSSEEAVRAVERLITQDKVDIVKGAKTLLIPKPNWK